MIQWLNLSHYLHHVQTTPISYRATYLLTLSKQCACAASNNSSRFSYYLGSVLLSGHLYSNRFNNSTDQRRHFPADYFYGDVARFVQLLFNQQLV